MYSPKVIDLFVDPENEGEMENPDAVGWSENRESADFFQVFLRVTEDGVIEDIKFTVFGCCEAVSAGSMMTILAKGKTLHEAQNMGINDVLVALNGLPVEKEYCAELAVSALKDALKDL